MLNLDTILNSTVLIVWVIFVVYTITSFVRSLLREGPAMAGLRLISGRVLFPLMLTISLSLLSASLVFVEPTRVAVVISLISPGGIRPEPLRSGLHFIVPVLESEVIYPISWQTYTMSSSPTDGNRQGNDSIRARTSDGQEVRIDSSIIFRVDPQRVVTLHIDWQSRYIEEYVRPVIRGLLRSEVSQFQAREVNSSARSDLESSLEVRLREEFAVDGLQVDRFLLRDLTFTDEYVRAIEAKQVALEGQERTDYEAQQVRNLAEGQRDKYAIEAAGRSQQFELEAQGRAKAILIEAEAQAEALQLIGEALQKNPDLLTYEYIHKLSPNIQVMLVPNNAPLILPLPSLNNTIASSDTMTSSVTSSVTGSVTNTVPPLTPPVSLDSVETK